MQSTIEEVDPPTLGVDDSLHISIIEGVYDFLTDDPPPHTVLQIETVSHYHTCCHKITVTLVSDLPNLHYRIDGIFDPGACLGITGPAKFQRLLHAENGVSNLTIENSGETSEMTLTFTDTLITIAQNDSSFIGVQHNEVWRLLPNSFYYKCSTEETSSWIYQDFADSILAIQGIEQFSYSESGWIPYPRYSGWGPINHACLYFQYPDDQTWIAVKDLVARYSTSIVSQIDGIHFYVANYLGDDEVSWIWD